MKTSQDLAMHTAWCKSKVETNLVSNSNTRIAFNQTVNAINKEKNDEKIIKSVIEKLVVMSKLVNLHRFRTKEKVIP